MIRLIQIDWKAIAADTLLFLFVAYRVVVGEETVTGVPIPLFNTRCYCRIKENELWHTAFSLVAS